MWSRYEYRVPSSWDLSGLLAFMQGSATDRADLSGVVWTFTWAGVGCNQGPGIPIRRTWKWAPPGGGDERDAGLVPRRGKHLWEKTT